MTSDHDDVQALARRVRRLEDHHEISALIASYGPAVDSGSADTVAGLWAPEGTYSYQVDGDVHWLEGQDSLRSMVNSDGHHGIIGGGSAHFLGPPFVRITGDAATATGYSMLVRHRDEPADEYYIDRLSVNSWKLERGADGWRVLERTNLLLDGDAAARVLLASGVN